MLDMLVELYAMYRYNFDASYIVYTYLYGIEWYSSNDSVQKNQYRYADSFQRINIYLFFIDHSHYTIF